MTKDNWIILNKQIIKKNLNALGNLIFISIIVFTLVISFFIVKSKINGGSPNIAGNKFYIVLSGSMKPVFDAGSIVAVKTVNPKVITAGDIITFKDQRDRNRIITHRVVDIKKENGSLFFITKGDANDAKDSSLVPAGNVIGKANFWLPYAGYAVNFTKSKKGIFILLIVPGMLYIISELISIYKLTRKNGKVAEDEKTNIDSEQIKV